MDSDAIAVSSSRLLSWIQAHKFEHLFSVDLWHQLATAVDPESVETFILRSIEAEAVMPPLRAHVSNRSEAMTP